MAYPVCAGLADIGTNLNTDGLDKQFTYKTGK
jgi:hypothetical protein